MLIIIVGPKHSGKTSAGKALAGLWKGAGAVGGEGGPALPGTARFVDLDDLVEEHTGRSPRSLYREGPELFRRAEAEALRSLLEEGHPGGRPEDPGDPAAGVTIVTIVAAGGGLADNGEALELLKTGRVVTVYLELPVERAWERIRAAAELSGELPPFLNTENPRETHRLLHERRARVYRDLATFTVKAGDTPEETAARILRSLGQLPEQGGE